MPTESRPRPFARQLFRAILGPGDITDRELLARFVATRDEDAFAELVRRHGPMALGVCRRVTGHPQDAEDAFQAAFLVLARRAGQVNRPDQLANWLYGVAYRTALEARAARRRVQEHLVSAVPEPAAPETRGLTSPGSPDADDLRRVIDEELAKLPDKYRSAVVLCDLEGLPRADAAVRLKIPEGTLSSRLAHARKVLAERLTRRGITGAVFPGAGLTAGAVAAALGREAVASVVPRELVLLTARAAARVTSGGVVPPDVVSPSVSNLADGVIKIMLVHRLRLSFGMGILACGLLGLGAYGLAQVPTQNAPPPPEVIRVNPNQNTANIVNSVETTTTPLDQPVQQPKATKVAPKGIEDDDVPSAATLAQAVIRLEEGKLIVRQRDLQRYSAVTTQYNGKVHTIYQSQGGVQATMHDPADVAVFDMKGNRLQPKAWKDKFKADVHCLVAFDGRLPNPRELGLFKEDTLIVVLPGGSSFGHPTTPAPPIAVPAFPSQPTRPANIPPPSATVPAVPGTRPVPPTPAIPPQNNRPAVPHGTAPPPPTDVLPPIGS